MSGVAIIVLRWIMKSFERGRVQRIVPVKPFAQMSVPSIGFWFFLCAMCPNARKTRPPAAAEISGMGQKRGSARNCVKYGALASRSVDCGLLSGP